MRKLIALMVIASIIGVLVLNVWALNGKGEVKLEDVNTLNFISKIGKEKSKEITRICSYDFCDYMRGSTVEESLEIFTRKYLETIEDADTQAYLNVMGIKITDVVWSN